MTDSLASGAFAEILAARASIDRERGRTATVRGVAVALVILLHVLLIAGLLIVERLPNPRRGAPPNAEVELILAPVLQPAAAPKTPPPKTDQKKEIQEFAPRPITVPPPEIEVPQNKQAPVDVMRAIGAALDCGASHYEYLNAVERKLCKHPPWKLPSDRALVLAQPAPPQPGHMTGAEAATKMRAQAPPCLPNMNTPCIDEVIYGKGPH